MTDGAALTAGRGPRRTCLGCRAVAPQAHLLRVARSAEGFVELDPGQRRGGRGAYLCPREPCLTEALRRGRWAQAFRAPTAVRPETAAALRALVVAAAAGEGRDGHEVRAARCVERQSLSKGDR